MSGSGYALAVLFAINLMNFFDRQLIGGGGEGIRREWALSGTTLGLLGSVFTLLYAVLGLPLGRVERVLHRGGAGHSVRHRGVDDARAEARHARTPRGRRPLPPGQSLSARAVDSHDAVGHRVGGAPQLQHVRAWRVRGAVPRA